MFHSTHDEGTQIAVRSYTSISHVVRQKCSYSNFGFAHPIEKAIWLSGSKAPRLVYAALSVPGPIGLPRSPTRNPQGHQQRNIEIGPCPTTNSYAQTICTDKSYSRKARRGPRCVPVRSAALLHGSHPISGVTYTRNVRRAPALEHICTYLRDVTPAAVVSSLRCSLQAWILGMCHCCRPGDKLASAHRRDRLTGHLSDSLVSVITTFVVIAKLIF